VRLKFRNITATPDSHVAEWGVEGIATAIERGGLAHLRRIAHEALSDPYGGVALDLEQAIAVADSPLAGLMGELLERARSGPRGEAANRVLLAIAQSGLTAREFAARLGTSSSRLSTYATGKVMPSAAALISMERLARS
jgi:hypothetical protein